MALIFMPMFLISLVNKIIYMPTFFILLGKKFKFLPIFLTFLCIFLKSIGIDAVNMVKKIKIVAMLINTIYKTLINIAMIYFTFPIIERRMAFMVLKLSTKKNAPLHFVDRATH